MGVDGRGGTISKGGGKADGLAEFGEPSPPLPTLPSPFSSARLTQLQQESSTASTNSILSAARSSALKRSTARSSTLLSSLPSSTLSLLLSGLPSSSEQEEEAEEDIFAELNKWDDYHSMYHLKSRKEGGYVTLAEGTVGDEGGFKVEETWEKVIRAGVMELWLDPVE